MDEWLNRLLMLLKSPIGEAEIPDVRPPLLVVDSQELGLFFTFLTTPYHCRISLLVYHHIYLTMAFVSKLLE